jgi:hypothetical protein
MKEIGKEKFKISRSSSHALKLVLYKFPLEWAFGKRLKKLLVEAEEKLPTNQMKLEIDKNVGYAVHFL